MTNLTYLKQEARRCGYTVSTDAYMKEFLLFYNNNSVHELNEDGKIVEIILCWLLGIMQHDCNNRHVFLKVFCTDKMDKEKTDLVINGRKIQLKYLWKFEELEESIRINLEYDNIHTYIINDTDKYGYQTQGSDILRGLLELCMPEEKVNTEVYLNPAFDAAEEVWQWFLNSSK